MWEEFQDEIKIGEAYKFENLRTKKYNSMMSIQSVRGKTAISRCELEVLDRNHESSKNSGHRSTEYDLGLGTNKELKDHKNLLNVSELLELQVV